MKKLSEKQGEKLPQDSVPLMMLWRNKDGTSWQGVEDVNNWVIFFIQDGESFLFEDESTKCTMIKKKFRLSQYD